MIDVARLGYDYPRLPAFALLGVCILQGWVLLFVPYLMIAWHEAHCLLYVTCYALAGHRPRHGRILLHATECARLSGGQTAARIRQAAHFDALGSAVGLVPLYFS